MRLSATTQGGRIAVQDQHAGEDPLGARIAKDRAVPRAEWEWDRQVEPG